MTNLSRICAAFLALSVYASAANAAPTDAERAVAVSLVVEGRARFQAKQYRAALELFKRAHEIMRVPTTGWDLAKAHEALGQLVEARRIAEEVARMPAEPNEKPIFAETRALAQQAIVELGPRIPLLHVRVSGAPVQDTRVQIDGNALTPDEANLPYPVNPGTHEVVVTAPDFETTKITVHVEEARMLPVDVTLKPAPRTVQPPPPTPPKPVNVEPQGWAPEAKAGFAVAGGLAGVAMGTGIGALVLYAPTRDAYPQSGRCYVADCGREYEMRRRKLEGFTWTMTASGVVGLGALVYALTRPRHSERPNGPTTGLLVAPTVGGMVVSGTF
ncbi:MAG: tetratricopeptide repeat protein [Polyangiaceae bacterium]|nr:tetratricopeptide repeat protein [Polyangiaceae bacterium]